MTDYSAYAAIGHNSAIATKNEVVELAQKQLALEKKIAQLEEELKETKAELRVVSEDQIPEKMDELGQEEFTTSDGIKIKIKEVVEAYISEERREAANTWLDENNYGNLLKSEVIASYGKDELEKAKALVAELEKEGRAAVFKRSVHNATLRAFVREHMAAGKDIPIDLFGINRSRQAKITLRKL